MCSGELNLSKANWKFKLQVQCIYIYSVWNSAHLSGICTHAPSNRSAVLSLLDISHRTSGNFSGSGFWQISEVGIMLWQRRLNQLLFKRLFLNTCGSSINLCRLNWEEASPYCYCRGDREVTCCSQPQVSTAWNWAVTAYLSNLSSSSHISCLSQLSNTPEVKD